jgi:CBS domain-containing protein
MESVVRKSTLLTLGDILRVVATGHERTAIVIDLEDRLHGVVSQGDLLKAIWNGASLSDPVDGIINPNPLLIVEGSDEEQTALKFFVEYGALLIPVVDNYRKLLRIVNVREVIKNSKFISD